ncbi:hypothetical protein D3C78_1642760 [compost metagenome]
MEACQPGRNEGSRGDPQRIDTQRAAYLSCRLTGFGDGNSHLSKQGGDTPVEQLATRRWRDASGRAIEQACANATFELSNGLAECRG